MAGLSLPLHLGDARLVRSCWCARARPTGLRGHWLALIAIGFLDTGGNALYAAAASSHGLLSVVSVLASLYPVVTVLLARLMLGERVQRTQDAGIILVLARRRLDHSGRLETRCSITARSSRTSSRQSPAGSGRFQSTYSLPGRTGQASPQPIVTTRSAHSTSARSSAFGVRPETSIPTSSSASTTASCSSAAGRDPAERASPPRRSYRA